MPDARPEISVLLPVRDAAPFLAEAFDSLRRQTHEDFEVVVQDDGSVDGSLEIARSGAREDPRVRVEGGPHRGIVAALNRAADRARASLLVRMDADDVSRPGRLAALAAAARAHPEDGFLGHRVRLFPRRSVRSGMRRYEAWVNGLLTHEEILRDRFVECPIPHPTWAVRRAVFSALGGYREGPFPEDYEFFLRAVQAGVRFHKLPEVLLQWREGTHRLCRRDPRYALGRFLELKARFVEPLLRESARPVAIVGAGTWGKRWARRLTAFRLVVRTFLDARPGRQGQRIHGAEVVGPEDLDRVRDCFLLVAVGREGGREAARATLAAAGLVEGVDFLCVQ